MMTSLLNIDLNRPLAYGALWGNSLQCSSGSRVSDFFPQQKGIGNEKKPDFFSDSGIC